MDLYNKLKEIGKKIEDLKSKIDTEESTKHAFTLPFINALGYDTFNPIEVVPEYTADIGLKKGEKVDYAIFQEDMPILIIECKHWEEKLEPHISQLFRYFHVTKTRFALLTNGIRYMFFTDLDEKNKMDKKPFLDFDITKLKENTIKEIEKFHKSKFDEALILNNANSLKNTKEIKTIIENEITEPSQEFVRLFANQIYNGRVTSKVISEFTDVVSKAFNQIISEKVNDRLNSALIKEQEKQEAEEINIEQTEQSKIITTDEELEGYQIILAILRRIVSKERISHRDTQSYFGVLFDDNNRKPICRLHLNGGIKHISLFDRNKNKLKEKIDSIDDIYKFEKELLDVVKYYVDQ